MIIFKRKKKKKNTELLEVLSPKKLKKNFFNKILVDLKKMNLLKKDNNLNLLDSYSIPFPLIKKEKREIF